MATMGLQLFFSTLAQEAVPSFADVAEVERVIVTGSNIPTAAEVGPNPVDTYRPSDLEKLGVRDATDFLINLPQELSGTFNQNLPASNQQLYRQIRAPRTALSNPVCETGANFWHK